jgi:hypothetical protein
MSDYQILVTDEDFDRELDQVLSAPGSLELVVALCRTLWEQRQHWKQAYEDEFDPRYVDDLK